MSMTSFPIQFCWSRNNTKISDSKTIGQAYRYSVDPGLVSNMPVSNMPLKVLLMWYSLLIHLDTHTFVGAAFNKSHRLLMDLHSSSFYR